MGSWMKLRPTRGMMGSWREVETNGRKDGIMEGSSDQWEEEWEHVGKLRSMGGRMGSCRKVETNGRNDKIMEGS
jgi:hypothetical protein